MNVGKLIAWLIVGALAGTLAGRVVTLSKEGLGRWTNIGVGLVGAVIGGFLFNLFDFDLGLGEIAITFEDLIAAFCGSLLLLILWWLYDKTIAQKKRRASKD
jgi:uncharacterized membrane protein YeaQ/YmgE (transglycosylase-associated protein family)